MHHPSAAAERPVIGYRGHMQHVERSARIPAPREAVFAFLSDLDHLADWQSGVVSARRTSPGPIDVGATAHLVRELMGQRIEAPLTVTVHEPPARLVIDSETGGVRATATLDLAAAPGTGDETDLTFAMEIRGSLVTRFLEGIVANAAGADIEASLARVRARFAEAGHTDVA
jgi:carbon monoxide dehydrogenase subunit G